MRTVSEGYNLLFGVLALQLDFIDRAQLVALKEARRCHCQEQEQEAIGQGHR